MSSGDLEALLRVTAPGYKGEPAPDIALGTTDGPVGRLVLAVTARGVVACSYEDEDTVYARIHKSLGGSIGSDPRRIDPVRRELDAYFEGRLRAFSTPADLQLAAPFVRTVLQMMLSVPYGTTTTYRDIAARIGRPQAVRAVSSALSANPVCLFVPCHRAVESTESLGGYAGGAEAKGYLLRLEGALA